MMLVLLSSLWVAGVLYCNFSLLMMHVLGSPGCEQLWCLAATLADDVCPWLLGSEWL
jgi:hypothetical protein